ncbi:MAG: 30S ribosomal protein S4 [Candidatus Anstonellales archaeon]
MGDPRKSRKKYETPRKIWDSVRIREERALAREYALKNVRELWSSIYKLKTIRRNARKLIAAGERGQKQAKDVIQRLARLGFVNENATLPDVLTISIRDILDRRLQSLVFKKGLANSYKQARQLITHGFIAVDGKRVSSPSYLVPKASEPHITYFKKIDLSGSAIKDKNDNKENQ